MNKLNVSGKYFFEECDVLMNYSLIDYSVIR